MAQAPATSDSGEEEIHATINSVDGDNEGEDTWTQGIKQPSSSALGEAGEEFANNTAPQNACDVIPKFWRIEVSDTGDYIPWNGAKELKQGDHIAWLRFVSYYHHAVVVDVEDDFNINVVEMSWNGNEENRTRLRTCGCSPLYRVYYPDNVLKFSPEEVVQRARELVPPKKSSDDKERADVSTETTGKGWRPWNNCEHSATWCKVDCSRCGQWRTLFVCTFLTYLRRPIERIICISLIMFFSEWFEEKSGRGDGMGVALLIGLEVIYLVIVACLIKTDFKRGRNFISNHGPSTRKRMRWAFLKSLLQSLVMVTVAIVFGVIIKNAIKKDCGPWNSFWKRIGVEAGLSFLGGIIGNMIGFLLFFLYPLPNLSVRWLRHGGHEGTRALNRSLIRNYDKLQNDPKGV